MSIISKNRGVTKQDGFIFNVINGNVYCNSNELAKKFKKRHDKVLEKIDKEIKRFISLSKGKQIDDFFRESSYVDAGNRTYRRFDLTFKGFQMIALTYNDKDAFENRLDFINAFETLLKKIAENKLQAQLNLKSDIWLEVRTEAKLTRTKFTDALNEVFMPQRVEEKKETAQFLERYISNFTNHIIYKKLNIVTPTGVKVNRDSFDIKTVIKVELLEEEVSKLIYKYKDRYYKDIYKDIKEELLK